MLQSFLSRATLIVLSSALAVLSVACNQDKQNTATNGNETSPPIGDLAAVQPAAEPTIPLASPEAQSREPFEIEPSFFELGLDRAAGAISISQSAQSPEDWKLVGIQFQEAITLMRKVRRQSSDFAIAQTKIAEYQRQIKYARQKATPSRQPRIAERQKRVVLVPQPTPTPKFTPARLPTVQTRTTLPPKPILPPSQLFNTEQEVFTAPIKRRVGGTPIIQVTFNGQRQFDMIVDTGASGTVITQQMANALGVVPIGKAKANTASSRSVEFPIGYIDSMAVAGVVVSRVPVAIAGAELETGLLGHDFFGNYDVTIKRNVVEFRPQSHAEINSSENRLIAPILPKQRHSVEYP
ncbi:MAG: retroviral-like aspartic protease family protein [Desmonostoc vinosum HA7617-LM4]|jgi:predicted aspartyl protease|nr:retroviral-like aspartic protease family protein [Desmonostoc vinosum HA7617-LM4]